MSNVYPPNCPDGHGAMEREPGFWAFAGVDKRPPRTLLGGLEFTPNNNGLVVKVWICPVCHLVRAYSDDSGE